MAYAEENAYAVVLGKVIAHLRQKKGWTQGQLAQQVGVQQSTLSRIESGSLTPDAFVLKRLAMSFGYSAAELNRLVDRAYERTQATAISATNTSLRKDAPWWQVALGVAGIVGLAGLAIFAVAAVLDEEDT
jgi:putative transcriptional regulator